MGRVTIVFRDHNRLPLIVEGEEVYFDATIGVDERIARIKVLDGAWGAPRLVAIVDGDAVLFARHEVDVEPPTQEDGEGV